MGIGDSGDHGETSADFIYVLVNDKQRRQNKNDDHVREEYMYYSYEEVEVAGQE